MFGLAAGLLGGAVSAAFKAGKIAVRFGLFISFIGTVGALSVFLINFLGTTYSKISDASGALSSQSLPDLLGCAMNALGIDSFLTSWFSLFFAGLTFFLFGASYIIVYKMGRRAYSSFSRTLR